MRLLIIICAMLLIVGAACSGSEDATPGPSPSPEPPTPIALPATPAPSATPTVPPLPDALADTGMLSLLHLMPVLDDTLDIQMQDRDRALAAFGVDPYSGSEADPEAVTQFFIDSSFFPGRWFRPGLDEPAAWRQSFGFSPTELQHVAEYTILGKQLIIFRAGTTADTVADAVATDPDWNAELTITNVGAATIYGWGEDYAGSLVRSTPPRFQGYGGQLAVLDDHGSPVLVRTIGQPELDPVLAIATGDAPSMADLPEYVEPMTLADTFQAHWVLTSGKVQDQGELQLPDQQVADLQPLLVAPYETITLASARVDDTPREMLVLHYADADDAAYSAAQLESLLDTGRTRAGELFVDRLGPAVVAVDGTNVVATFAESSNGRRLLDLWLRVSYLFWAADG